MLRSIDCMHWKWKNCSFAWTWMYSGHVHEPTIILGVVVSYDLWIWHALFGLSGSHNDINVLERSSIFNQLTEDRAPLVNYLIHGHNHLMGYYLADGIYPSWVTFVKTISASQGSKRKLFDNAQESARKDEERAFRVLQARFTIVRGPTRFWDQEILKDIMTAYIIMHNMIIENEQGIPQRKLTLDSHSQLLKLKNFMTNPLRALLKTLKEEWYEGKVTRHDHFDALGHIDDALNRVPT
ncbi:hypothetical protein Ddye_022922 [Dipteronia dyeriana]|uniref:Uncharacterized protein n=1 Tax=Dipteronia dyeriana TaxID=168575 RepID=A0AAD9WRM8_9ROSI|nr:hypothetical protein Ddye_022922 [Dipteronia dyeriana]